MNRKDYILFDLDGTLTDPKEGITKSVQHALEHFGVQTDDLDKPDSVHRAASERQLSRSITAFRMNRHGKGCWYTGSISVSGAGMRTRSIPALRKCWKPSKEAGKSAVGGNLKPEVFARKILESF
ncbi:MAG: HAD hydrolase-like protein [Enterocloster sp.]